MYITTSAANRRFCGQLYEIVYMCMYYVGEVAHVYNMHLIAYLAD